MPHEGTNNIAFALISFENLAAYENYRARLRTDEEGMANFNFAEENRFILAEERTFLRQVTCIRAFRHEGEAMIAVIFEVWPKPEHKQEYLDLAAELKPILETIDGFISVERFESLTEKGKILSLRCSAMKPPWRHGAMCRNIAGPRARGARRFSGITGCASLASSAITA